MILAKGQKLYSPGLQQVLVELPIYIVTNHLSCTLSVLFGHYWLLSSFVID